MATGLRTIDDVEIALSKAESTTDHKSTDKEAALKKNDTVQYAGTGDLAGKVFIYLGDDKADPFDLTTVTDADFIDPDKWEEVTYKISTDHKSDETEATLKKDDTVLILSGDLEGKVEMPPQTPIHIALDILDMPAIAGVEFLQGDFNDDQTTAQMVTGTVISMIPFVDQICDVRDVVANCKKINQDSANKWHWVALALTLIGLFPTLGSLVKGCFKVLFAYGRKGVGVASLKPASDVRRQRRFTT